MVLTVFTFTTTAGEHENADLSIVRIIGVMILTINLILCWLNFRSSKITSKRILTILILLITVIYAVFFLYILQQNNH
jgi:hypothetical protein